MTAFGVLVVLLSCLTVFFGAILLADIDSIGRRVCFGVSALVLMTLLLQRI